jgi:hypothetical protein
VPLGEIWTPYGASEGLPVLDATVTAPTLTESKAMYKVTNGFCQGYMRARWGAGSTGGSGTYGILMPPPAPDPLTLSAGYVPMAGDAFGQRNVNACGLAYNPTVMTLIPAARTGLMSPSPLMQLTVALTAAQTASQTAVVVNHNCGAAPDAVIPYATSDPAAGNMINPPWIDTVTATQFTVHFNPALNATGVAMRFALKSSIGLLQVTNLFPWTWQNGCLLEAIIGYPVAA